MISESNRPCVVHYRTAVLPLNGALEAIVETSEDYDKTRERPVQNSLHHCLHLQLHAIGDRSSEALDLPVASKAQVT